MSFRYRSGGQPVRRQAPRPPVPRLARSYQSVTRSTINWAQYPAVDIDSLSPAIHDIQYLQGLFENVNNFAADGSNEVFELRTNSNNELKGQWRPVPNPSAMSLYINTLDQLDADLKMRVIFCTLKPCEKTSFGLQLSLSKEDALEMLSSLKVCPQFCNVMLGEPDYWAPLSIKTRQADGKVTRTELVCQHPRYTIHTRQQPCCTYVSYDIALSSTTYIVVHGQDEAWVNRAKARITTSLARTTAGFASVAAEAADPYLIQSILCHESLTEAKVPITTLRHQLYDVLDIVGEYSKEPFDRSNLKDMTNLLHKVSQDADSLYASAQMGSMVAQHSQKARMYIVGDAAPASNVGDSLEYLVESIDSQKRWLQTYVSRKETAMNLVFNLVTQQDSETSTEIARDTKDDSASMKIIAVLTMVFLPATAVSSFFGMSFFSVTDRGVFVLSQMCWLFAAITIPLTFGTFALWLFWYPLLRLVQRVKVDSLRGSDPAPPAKMV